MRAKTFTFATFMFLVALTAPAQFICATNGGAITITGYTGSGGAVIIPTNLYGLPVTSIANEAFYENRAVTSLAIPDTVTNLGEYAFYDCAKLAGVTMPAGLIAIGDYTFEGCSALTNLAIPADVTTMGAGTFSGCSNLSAIALSSNLTSIGLEEFAGCSSLTNVTIPFCITSIGEYAFSGCIKLNNITIPGTVTNIGYGGFLNCSNLTTVAIPNSVASIGQYAFYNCPRLASVYFNGNVPGADATVFAGDETTAYYLPTTGGWAPTFAGIPTAYWTLPYPMILTGSAYPGPRGRAFFFTIFWATNTPAIVQASTDLVTWTPISTNSFNNGLSSFTDIEAGLYPNRFYRVTPPQ